MARAVVRFRVGLRAGFRFAVLEAERAVVFAREVVRFAGDFALRLDAFAFALVVRRADATRSAARPVTALAPPIAAKVFSRAWSNIDATPRVATFVVEAPASFAPSFIDADIISAAACSSSASVSESNFATPSRSQNSARFTSAR